MLLYCFSLLIDTKDYKHIIKIFRKKEEEEENSLNED